MMARRASGGPGGDQGFVPPSQRAFGDARREELTRLVMAAQPTPFWLDRHDAPAPREPLRGEVSL